MIKKYCGITVSDGKKIHQKFGMGLVFEVLKRSVLKGLKGKIVKKRS